MITYKEFEQRVSELNNGLYTTYNDSYFLVSYDGYKVAKVMTTGKEYHVRTYRSLGIALYNLLTELTSAPIKDPKEEKKYRYLKKSGIVGLYYLNWNVHEGTFGYGTKDSKPRYKTTFTEIEFSKFSEVFRIDEDDHEKEVAE